MKPDLQIPSSINISEDTLQVILNSVSKEDYNECIKLHKEISENVLRLEKMGVKVKVSFSYPQFSV